MLAQLRLGVPRLLWVGPLAVFASVTAVVVVHLAALLILDPPPRGLREFDETVGFTAVLVTIGVVVFGVVKGLASDAVRTYRRIAFVALIVSLLPDIALGMGWLIRGEGWTLATVFMIMHVVAWLATVEILTRLGMDRAVDAVGAS